ncbi:MAG: peptidase, partial [Nitrosopumilus sp.]
SSVQSYIQDGTINVLRGQNGTDAGATIPAWVKSNACLWADSQLSDYEFLDGIYWLIDNGKIVL